MAKQTSDVNEPQEYTKEQLQNAISGFVTPGTHHSPSADVSKPILLKYQPQINYFAYMPTLEDVSPGNLITSIQSALDNAKTVSVNMSIPIKQSKPICTPEEFDKKWFIGGWTKVFCSNEYIKDQKEKYISPLNYWTHLEVKIDDKGQITATHTDSKKMCVMTSAK